MKDQETESYNIQHYFVDEAGDPNLFTKRGKNLLGEQGCSNYFKNWMWSLTE